MARVVRILAVHGIGHQEAKIDQWLDEWKRTILRGLSTAAAETGETEWVPEVEFFFYDQTFEKPGYPLNGKAYWDALRELGSGMLLRESPDAAPGTRGVFEDFTHGIRWTVGMVAQWVAYAELRRELNTALLDKIRATRPDVVLAHSLGSLISYDALAQAPSGVSRPRMLVTFGSQIGHPAVLGSIFGGRIGMPNVGSWFHLYNPRDRVLTAELRLSSPQFQQLETGFDERFDVFNHGAVEYLAHANTGRMWESIVTSSSSETTLRAMHGLFTQTRRNGAMYRALIVGIDEHADPRANLEGCVNDAYRMSETLQELQFPPEQIRLVLNERATANAIRDRLAWLLDDVQPGDVRFLHYSGHGAQIPAYGPNAEVDQFDECLVPYDFDWSPHRAILDDWFYRLYAQLPYDARFIAVLDCCHSGGLTRAGGIRVRGLNPPDDIRHRAMKFEDSTWKPRDWKPFSTAVSSRPQLRRQLTGEQGTSHRLCGALPLRRTASAADYRECQESYRHRGPYLPVLLQACAEQELAEEVRVGSTPHGAFSYHLTSALRKLRRSRKRYSYKQLITEATRTMRRAGLTQQPQLVGPTSVISQPVPPEERLPRPKSKGKSGPKTAKRRTANGGD